MSYINTSCSVACDDVPAMSRGVPSLLSTASPVPLWSRRASVTSSLIEAIPLHPSGSAPPFHLPSDVGTHLLMLISLSCRAPTSSGGNPFFVHCPPLVGSVEEVSSNQFPRDLLYECGTTDPAELCSKTLLLPIPTSSVIEPSILLISLNSVGTLSLPNPRLLHMVSSYDSSSSCASIRSHDTLPSLVPL
ncbi:uncharacterized protein UBRO_20830 [Ustilago bromivora]|uniref:Uncharacterized protein n=1 Tax=Ustilago bromivora TaxID=307758 RepID=A0A1K0G9A7_9BASI|nr:uncharacterized protein UBRO_20830 [Ustilago bromivora]